MADLFYNGCSFEQRDSDGMVNLSAMCRAHGKSIADWARKGGSKAYVAALASVMGFPRSKFLVSNRVGDPAQRGVWGHPLVAIAVAQWLSPEFCVWLWVSIRMKRLVKPVVDASALQQTIANWIAQPCRAEDWINAGTLKKGIRGLRNSSPNDVRDHMRNLVRLGLALEDGEGIHYRIKSVARPSLSDSV
jgi:hypothetical protein